MIGSLLRLLYPDRCLFCGDASEQGPCCKACERSLPFIDGALCIHCGHRNRDCHCGGSSHKPYEWIIAPFFYEKGVREAVRRFKFGGKQKAAQHFAPLVARQLRNAFPVLPFDLITCVPMNKRKEAARGYNQADLLGRELAKELKVEYQPGLLRRLGLLTQHDLRAVFRRRNAELSFAIAQPEYAKGRSILVVDDIFTTGSTMSVCCSRLLENGATAAFGAVIARTPSAKTDPEGAQ